ncbi:hypothetical protein [Paenibacillus sp. N3.4]|uniref:hypothetical protein n=1 Tax=Paenibacillus sp. N3.4 TaxID=2603222 RepID=UPI0011C9B997|nr:hypothetical protein [Paenibacillus sp. N3.4]TXK76951.1 hypothetical protein FU659_24045 [Paenibacillus sp. N3.4]
MKVQVFVFKLNLLPWYNELTDSLTFDHPDFPGQVRERIADIGEFEIVSISRRETRLKKKRKPKIEKETTEIENT